ncbi:MAG: CoA-binding protein [Actinomycetota bacterium]
MTYGPDDAGLARILREARTIAVVGLSSKPDRPSYDVAAYLQRKGYRIVPVNPRETEVLGEPCYPTLADIPDDVHVDIVDVFRRAEDTPAVAEEAVLRGAPVLWLQLGIENDDARRIAEAVGMTVIMDRCIKVDHRLLEEASP